MGFNYFNYGNIHPCRVQDKKIIYRLRSGMEISADCSLDVNIPEQVNLFISDRVMWLLYHEDKEYIGRQDGSISVYRVADGLLVGLGFWEAPPIAQTYLCGMHTEASLMTEIHMDMRDRQTVYICKDGIEGIIDGTYSGGFKINDAIFSAAAFCTKDNYHMFNERGDVIEVSHWFIQDAVRRRDCQIFL